MVLCLVNVLPYRLWQKAQIIMHFSFRRCLLSNWTNWIWSNYIAKTWNCTGMLVFGFYSLSHCSSFDTFGIVLFCIRLNLWKLLQFLIHILRFRILWNIGMQLILHIVHQLAFKWRKKTHKNKHHKPNTTQQSTKCRETRFTLFTYTWSIIHYYEIVKST